MKPHRIDRRQFLGWAGAAAGGLSILGCQTKDSTATPSGNSKGAFAGQTLRLFIYSGFWEKTIREAFAPRFQAQTGATVIPDPGWWDSIPKLKASPPGQPAFDLVLTDATQGYPAIREGLFQKIDLNRIPNLGKIAPSVLDNWVYHEGYGIPFPDGVMTLGYNKKLLNVEPQSWGDLMRDDVKGKLGLYNSFYMSLYTFACLKVAAEGRPGTAAAECANNLNGVIQFARENRDRVKYWYPTSTDMAFSLSQQNCSIGNVSSGAMLSALRQRPELGAVVPDADRAFVQLMWVIPAGARKELAEEAINLILSEEMQEALAMNGSATPMLSVAQKAAASDPLWGQIYPSTEEALKNVKYYPYDVYFKDWDNIVATWDKEILRKG
jgi:putative spermidine/putrescine transport system substrate-binding protein